MRARLSGELTNRASMLFIKLLAFDEGVRDDHQTYAIAYECTVGYTSCVGRMRAGSSGELPNRASLHHFGAVGG